MQAATLSKEPETLTVGKDVTFVTAIPGFPEYRRFAIHPAPEAAPFHWLRSLENPNLAFPVVPAAVFQAAYRPAPVVMQQLDATDWDSLACWIIVAVPSDGGPVRPNLAAPVMINPDNLRCVQAILHEPKRPRPNRVRPRSGSRAAG